MVTVCEQKSFSKALQLKTQVLSAASITDE